MSLWRYPRTAAALCIAAVLACAAAPAAFLAASDAAYFGRVETVADPYRAPTPTADDYYILRQLAARGLTIPHYFLDDAGGAGTIIGALSRMQAVVSMRLHALIFAAGQGIPLAGVVYDPKVSAFLRYIGQEQFVDLAELTGQNLCAMIDRCVAQAAHPEAQAAAVRNLQAMEQKNVEVARRLLKG